MDETISEENKSGYWQKHSEAWRSSGLSQSAYCAQEDLPYNRFVYQHSLLLKKESSTGGLNFIKAKPVVAEPQNMSSGLFLVLPNGIRIGINGAVNAALLQTVLSVAGSLRC